MKLTSSNVKKTEKRKNYTFPANKSLAQLASVADPINRFFSSF